MLIADILLITTASHICRLNIMYYVHIACISSKFIALFDRQVGFLVWDFDFENLWWNFSLRHNTIMCQNCLIVKRLKGCVKMMIFL